MKNKIIWSFFIPFVFINLAIGQENLFSKHSIKTGIGVGIDEGEKVTGIGFVYTIGYQRNFGKKEKLRISPILTSGSFNSNYVDDARDSFYQITNFGLLANYDLIKYKSVSLFLVAGGFVNYTRGMIGTGGENNIISSEYFNAFNYGGTTSFGIRINPLKSRISYEIKPMTISFGNKEYLFGYMMFGIDYKLKK